MIISRGSYELDDDAARIDEDAYLADVYVLPEARGRGLGKELVRTMIDAARVLACAGPCTPPMRTACTASSASPRPMPCTWSGRPP